MLEIMKAMKHVNHEGNGDEITYCPVEDIIKPKVISQRIAIAVAQKRSQEMIEVTKTGQFSFKSLTA